MATFGISAGSINLACRTVQKFLQAYQQMGHNSVSLLKPI